MPSADSAAASDRHAHSHGPGPWRISGLLRTLALTDSRMANRNRVSVASLRAQTSASRWGVGYGTPTPWPGQRREDASARPALAATRWRSMARYTVERPTPKSSAASAVLYSPLCTKETR